MQQTSRDRYFFDLVGPSRAHYDYKGREHLSPQGARELAELIALDLAVTAEETWLGFAVDVRNSAGRKIFSVTVPVLEPALQLAS
jgi:hypothetical protein